MGGWHCAVFRLDRSNNLSAIAEDLLRAGAPVSIGFSRLRAIEDDYGFTRQYTLVQLNELSVLGSGDTPVYDGARIVYVLPEVPARTARPPADTILRRPHTGVVRLMSATVIGAADLRGQGSLTAAGTVAVQGTAKLQRRKPS